MPLLDGLEYATSQTNKGAFMEELFMTKFLILLQLVSFLVISFLLFVKRNPLLILAIIFLQVIVCAILLFGGYAVGEMFIILAPSLCLFFHGYLAYSLKHSDEFDPFDYELIVTIFFIVTLPTVLFMEGMGIFMILK